MNITPVVEFLKALFSATEQPIFLQTLANDPDDPDEGPNKRHLLSRDIAAIERFIAKHNRARRGMFVCVATIAEGSGTRSKDNCREICVLHADLDFKGIAEDEPAIWAAIAKLEAQPSIIVRSGGGLHLYWLLREPLDAQTHRDTVDALLRQIAEIVAGDLAVCEVARLMRLPGTGNSKYGDIREVRIERLDAELRYELEGLAEWASYQRPVLTRKVVTPAPKKGGSRPSKSVPENPFLAAAAAMGRQPRLDVEEALAAMGEGNIHDTQVRVSAALLARGEAVEDTVSILMEATRQAVGQSGNSWNWKAEEKRIRTACAGALKKFPPKEAVREDEPEMAHLDTDNVADLATARARRQTPPKPKRGKINHLDIGEIFLAGLEASGQALMFTDNGAHRYEDGLWHALNEKTMHGWINSRIEQCIRGTEAKSKISLVNETRAWVIRHPDLQAAGDVAFDGHGMVPTASGLVDPSTGDLVPYAPGHFATWRTPFVYNPDAIYSNWLQLLEDAFADRTEEVRAEYIQLLQEWLGMALLDDRAKALSCILFFQGGSDYGKSEIVNVLAGLFGRRRNTTPIDMLDKPHGLMAFASRVPWVLPEAFDQGKWHFSSVTKALASGEPVQINMKNGAIFDHTYTGPIIWGANSDPQFKEATAAITNRILIVPCRRKFDPEVPVGVAILARAAGFDKPSQLVLRYEMPGVLAWAVEGMLRARARGHFLRPEESRTAAKAVQRDNNIVLSFVEDCVDFDPDAMVSVPDFTAAFASWWAESKGGERGIPGSESVSKALKALSDPRIAFDLRSNSRRYYAGIHLNHEGKRYWSNTVSSEAFIFQARKASTTESGGDPNLALLPSWEGRGVIIAMRKAHEARVTVEGGATTDTVNEPVTVPKPSRSLSPTLSSTQLPEFPEDIPF